MQRMNYESLSFASVMVHCWCIFVSLLYLLLWKSNISSSDTTTASFFSPLSSFLFLLGHLPIATQIKNLSLVPSFVKVILAVQLSAFVMPILFGAPLTRDYDKTLAFSITVAALLFAPVISETENYKSFLTMNKFSELLELIARSSVFTVLGAWVSAVVIPLDWDRPWQVWPEPCCIGALLGSIVDRAVSLFHLWIGKKRTKSRFL